MTFEPGWLPYGWKVTDNKERKKDFDGIRFVCPMWTIVIEEAFVTNDWDVYVWKPNGGEDAYRDPDLDTALERAKRYAYMIERGEYQ